MRSTTFPGVNSIGRCATLLQNSAVLTPFQHSFRLWLKHECGRLEVQQFPPADFLEVVSLNGAI